MALLKRFTAALALLVATQATTSLAGALDTRTDPLGIFVSGVGLDAGTLADRLGGDVNAQAERAVSSIFCEVHQRFETPETAQREWVERLRARILARRGAVE